MWYQFKSNSISSCDKYISSLDKNNILLRQNIIYWNPRNHLQLLSKKSWLLGIWNGPIARGFWNLNQSIEQKDKNLQLEKCRYTKDIKIMFWDTAQYFHSKQLRKLFKKSVHKNLSRFDMKGQKGFFLINIVTCSFMPVSLKGLRRRISSGLAYLTAFYQD